MYADESLLVCEKPVGVSSESPGLPDLIQEQEGFPVFPVHRLDQTTGGAMMLARSPAACAALQRQFQEDLVIKEYLAVVSGVPETDSGLFSDLLYHDQRSNKTFVVDKPRKGVKEASCSWTVVETTEGAQGALSLIRIRLHSGRTPSDPCSVCLPENAARRRPPLRQPDQNACPGALVRPSLFFPSVLGWRND